MHKFYLILSIVFLSVSAHAKTTVYFSPGLDCEEQVIRLISNAKKTIDVAIYTLTNEPIGKALETAQNNGVKIRILTDKTQASGKYALAPKMYQNGFDIRVHSKHRIEHNKFMVVDGTEMITGSYNWTDSATWKNSENCLVIWEDQNTIDQYQKRFEWLWEVNTKVKSDAFFKTHMAN